MDIREKVKSLPLTSGVYRMKNKAGSIVYIGKAISLRKRVQSYFRASHNDPKIKLLMKEVVDVDSIPTTSEAEALILEASLIKKYKPKYNVELRDDKSYPYIQVTREPFPLISIVRPRTKDAQTRYYGPYVNAQLVRAALTIIRKIFPFRICDTIPKKACLDHHIGLCLAPCIGAISKRDYARTVRNVRFILEGRKDTLYNTLRREMEACVRAKKFEQAAQIRDQIRAIGALYAGTTDINYYKEAEQLQRVLGLPRRPERIETFDISNIMGTEAVGVMVSFLNGKPDKSNYRRFRIREINTSDDCAMIAEVVRRRYQRLKTENRLFPDLIIIDGGKGQLSSAYTQLKALGIDTMIISIAKRQEGIFMPNRKNALVLSRDSLGLHLIQRTRDEAHRFAVSYHRTLRSKKTFSRG